MIPMTCSGVRGLLPLFVGGDLAESRMQEVREHLAGCTECSSELRVFEECRRILEDVRQVGMKKNEVKKVWTTVRGEIPLLRIPKRSRALQVLRYAAIVIVGLSVGFTATTLFSGMLPADTPAADPVDETPIVTVDDPFILPTPPDRVRGGRVKTATGGEKEPDPTGHFVKITQLPVTRTTVSEEQVTRLQSQIRALQIQNAKLELRVRQLEGRNQPKSK
jgi:hypothetical protein